MNVLGLANKERYTRTTLRKLCEDRDKRKTVEVEGRLFDGEWDLEKVIFYPPCLLQDGLRIPIKYSDDRFNRLGPRYWSDKAMELMIKSRCNLSHGIEAPFVRIRGIWQILQERYCRRATIPGSVIFLLEIDELSNGGLSLTTEGGALTLAPKADGGLSYE